MANQKNNSSKNTTKKQSAKKDNAAEVIAAQTKKKREIAAIVLLVSGILTFLIAVIKGESGWTVMHNFLFGAFGFCSFVIPILLIYLAVIVSMDKFSKSIIPKSIEVGLLWVFLSITIYMMKSFTGGPFSEYAGAMKEVYAEFDPLGSGLFGAFFGFPLGVALGPTGAKVVAILATFTDLMIITGTTVSKLTSSAQKVHQKAKNDREERKIKKAEQKEMIAAVQRNDDLAYDEQAVYRSRKTPNLDIIDPDPDVLTGIKTKRAKNQRTKKYPVAVETPVEPAVHSEDELIHKDFTVEEFDSKMHAIEQAENQRKQLEKLEKAEGEMEKNDTISALDTAGEKLNGNASTYKFPPLSYLRKFKTVKGNDFSREKQETEDILIETLRSFGVEVEPVGITEGPTVVRYEVKPAFGVRINKITNLSADLGLALATSSIRIAPIPNKSAIGIEVPNPRKNTVGLRNLLESHEFGKLRSKKLTVALGENIAGEPQFADLSKMPHLLIAGTTGSGKSVCLNSMIISILYNARPDQVQFIMIDPKGVELSVYNGIPHMPTPVVKNPNKAAGALAWAVKEMMRRYALLEEYKVKDIKSYNKLCKENPEMLPMTQFVIVIDELADLMMVAPNEVEDSICRLAQMARAAGMHLVIATQSPRADVITGLIKSNIPSRIALSVANNLESRIILEQGGAEQLLGNGDMLFNPIGSNKPTRIQGCFVSEEEIEKITDFIKKQGQAEYDSEIEKQFNDLAVKEKGKKGGDMDPQGESAGDELIPKAVELILEYGNASTSFLQRRLSIGYSRGARIIDELEAMGIIGPQEGSKPRKILITKNEWLERNATSASDQISLNDNEINE